MSYRIGQGWDFHRLVPGRPLVLGGVKIPSELGELGHSDGDVLLHALTDAILGSIAEGDIGMHFSPSDERWKNADSRIFVKEALCILKTSGWEIVNIDSTIILEKPKLSVYINDIRASITELVGLPVNSVSVKAKTKEGLDAVGQNEAIEAQVVIMIKAQPFALQSV